MDSGRKETFPVPEHPGFEVTIDGDLWIAWEDHGNIFQCILDPQRGKFLVPMSLKKVT